MLSAYLLTVGDQRGGYVHKCEQIIAAARNHTCQIAYAIINNEKFYTADYYKHEI